MSKSLKNDRRWNDEEDYDYIDTKSARKAKKAARRQDKRRELPCEHED